LKKLVDPFLGISKVMIKYQGGGPPVSIKATRTILNPWYKLPAHITVFGSDLPSASDERLEITPPCRVELEEQGLRLLFRNDEVVFVFTGGSLAPRYLINPILYFLTYQTFINYNLIGPVTNPIDASAFHEIERITFKVERIIRVEAERQDGGKVNKGFYHTGKDESLEIAAGSIAQYLRILNPTLYYSLSFYLIGCDNPRYFLIEFYKAVEVITNEFGSKDEFLKSLKSYGVTKRKFKDFGEVCNDMRLTPLDIGRHAPMPGAPLYSVDLRNLLVEPRSRDVLESSTVFCRKVIDAYMVFLIQRAA
jgi:hypothetical protein